jgi:hypothetical protein
MTDKVTAKSAGDAGFILTGEAQSPSANLKSDVEAKNAFTRELTGRGFESVRVTRQPADITAARGGEIYYFEVKYTGRIDSYFGAATLTEWEAALRHEDRYWFVVASKRDGRWMFHEYTPAEFMEFSTIPPFKAYFNVDVNLERDTRTRGATKSIRLTRQRLQKMVDLFKSFRSE